MSHYLFIFNFHFRKYFCCIETISLTKIFLICLKSIAWTNFIFNLILFIYDFNKDYFCSFNFLFYRNIFKGTKLIKEESTDENSLLADCLLRFIVYFSQLIYTPFDSIYFLFLLCIIQQHLMESFLKFLFLFLV